MSAEATPRNPFPTVDIIIEVPGERIVLIKRRNPPHGWALPGGFVDYGESCEAAAVREAREETNLDVSLIRQLHTYSDPGRDPRHHTITTVFVAHSVDAPAAHAGDDAADLALVTRSRIPWDEMCFDHAQILRDYYESTTNEIKHDDRGEHDHG